MNAKFSRSMTKRLASRAALALAVAIAAGVPSVHSQDRSKVKVDVTSQIGISPDNFEFSLRGEGSLGQWTVVRDPTAVEGVAIEHVSTDQRDDRFPLAIYQPVHAENV